MGWRSSVDSVASSPLTPCSHRPLFQCRVNAYRDSDTVVDMSRRNGVVNIEPNIRRQWRCGLRVCLREHFITIHLLPFHPEVSTHIRSRYRPIIIRHKVLMARWETQNCFQAGVRKQLPALRRKRQSYSWYRGFCPKGEKSCMGARGSWFIWQERWVPSPGNVGRARLSARRAERVSRGLGSSTAAFEFSRVMDTGT